MQKPTKQESTLCLILIAYGALVFELTQLEWKEAIVSLIGVSVITGMGVICLLFNSITKK